MSCGDIRGREHDVHLLPQRQIVTLEPRTHRWVGQLNFAPPVSFDLDHHAAKVLPDPVVQQQGLRKIDHGSVNGMCASVRVRHRLRQRRQSGPDPVRRLRPRVCREAAL